MRKAFVLFLAGVLASAGAAAETKIGPRGQVVVNGKAVIPLGVWSQPTYLFEYYRHLGMNCIVGVDEPRREFRDVPDAGTAALAGKLGLLVTPDRLGLPADHPAIWGRLDGVLFAQAGGRLRDAYARGRRADANHFLMVNIPVHDFLLGRNPDSFAQGLRGTDAVISHVWPECIDPNRPDIRNVGKFVDLVRTYCKDRPGGEVCIWPDINPHAWTRKKQEGGTVYPPPSPEELRFQIWLALIHGADAICFFPVSFEPMFVYAQIPARNEQELAWNSRLIEKMTSALTAEESPLQIEVSPVQPGGLLDYTTRTVGGRHYVFLLNGQRQEQTVRLRSPGLGSKWRLRDAVRDAEISAAGGEFSEKLPGLALRVWELAPVAPAAPATREAAAGTGSAGAAR